MRGCCAAARRGVAFDGSGTGRSRTGHDLRGAALSDSIEKVFVDAATLRLNSVRLARKIWEDGFRPDFLIGIWRGGTPPGILIHEFFRLHGHDPYHTTIKTQSYRGMQRGSGGVEVKGLEHVIDVVEATDRVLLVDDVFDTGHTMAALLKEFELRARRNAPECRIGTVYYKPTRNETAIEPHYWQVDTDEWIVFPHELDGLSNDEIRAKGTAVAEAVLGESAG